MDTMYFLSHDMMRTQGHFCSILPLNLHLIIKKKSRKFQIERYPKKS